MPHPIDVHVGSRIKIRRKLLRMSQSDLGKVLGYSFQQIQKYEKGTNRVSASKLVAIANALNVPITVFFDDLPSELGGEDMVTKDVPLMDDATLRLVADYQLIGDQQVRASLSGLVKQLARSAKAQTVIGTSIKPKPRKIARP
jgi:transcriptional regulator with XRE-family HTH domain